METTNFKARTVGAFATVLALALILPNILHSEKETGFVSDIPPKPDTPDWVDESQNTRVLIELDELASGEVEDRLAPPEPRLVEEDDPKMLHIASDRSSLDDQGAVVAWTLQAGAFKDTANAEKFRDKLRAKKFKAYIIKNSKTNLEHVYVGPMLQHSKAEEERARLLKEMSIKGIRLQQYKPE